MSVPANPRADLFSSDRDDVLSREVLVLPCGKCDLCVRTYKRNWACRCICEAQTSNGGQFLTLTCSDDSQLRTFPDNNLIHKPFQDFMKRLRKEKGIIDLRGCYCDDIARGDYDYTHRIRYFMCGEYGSLSHRAHYHAILFGVDFQDKYQVGYSKSGQPLYSAPALDRARYVNGVEIFGPVSNFAPCSPADICYTVGYVDKKLWDNRREVLTDSEGKIYKENRPYVKMSRRPGIGYDWLEKYHGDVWKFYNDEVLLNDCVYATQCGAKYFPPRYFFDSATIGKNGKPPLISEQEKSIIISDRRCRVSEVCSSQAAMLEDLKRTHDKCVIYRQRQSARCVREGFGEG